MKDARLLLNKVCFTSIVAHAQHKLNIVVPDDEADVVFANCRACSVPCPARTALMAGCACAALFERMQYRANKVNV